MPSRHTPSQTLFCVGQRLPAFAMREFFLNFGEKKTSSIFSKTSDFRIFG